MRNDREREDAFSRCHPLLNFFYFAVVLVFTMFNQHPLFLAVSYAAAVAYSTQLGGWRKTLKRNFLFALPAFLLVTLLNPLFSHYGVTMLYYIESSGNWITLEALVYGAVLGSVMIVVIQWFFCYNRVMTSDKFIYLFGKVIPALSLVLSMALRFVPRFQRQLTVIRNSQKALGRDVTEGTFLRKSQHGLNILSVLITWALENAIETSDSMKSRGYGLKGRTAFAIYRFTTRDKLMGAAFLILTAVMALGCAKGAAFARYDPRILLAGFTIQGHAAPVECGPILAALTYAAFGLFCFLPVLLNISETLAMEQSRKSAGAEICTTYRRIYEELEQEGQKQ